MRGRCAATHAFRRVICQARADKRQPAAVPAAGRLGPHSAFRIDQCPIPLLRRGRWRFA
ncbi:hypothetical protein BURCENBC7_AP3156 [Burkholderia cenocepacia BC7]|nr:uncharacterized protein BCN122_II1161 [Burkholderia cenocepacia]EPZ88063.1 hypothetical protein BURCENK562V_C3183 [Burkholderia cenocepacia K56-2Valvano]ERI29270.1 hypothetical protein BURCENBC7_AP3156 [Burkholderia cenocepacia BC7]